MATNFTVHSCGGSRGFDRVPFLASAWAEEPRRCKATHGLRMGQCFGFFWIGGISVAAGVAAGGFALTASHLFQTPGLRFGVWGHIRSFGCCLWRFRSYSESPFPNAEKVTQKALPRRTALRLGSVFPRYGVHPGASPPVCFAAPPLDVCGFAAWRCAPSPLWTPTLGLPKGQKIKSHIKSQSQSRSKDRSLRQLLHGIGCVQLEFGWLAGRLREQARSHSWNECVPLEIGRLSGRLREQARSHSWNGCVQLEIGRLSGRHRQQAESVHPMRRSRPTQHDER